MRVSHSKSTTSHDEIKTWVESHQGKPATVKGTEHGGEHVGSLQIDLPANGDNGEKLKPVEWDEFFKKFEESKLKFLYSDEKNSTFNKFVSRGHGK